MIQYKSNALKLSLTLIPNFIFSWIVLLFLLFPGLAWGVPKVFEVLFWQAIGFVGWPMALFGALASFLLQPDLTALRPLMALLAYPLLIVLAVVVVRGGSAKRWWALALFHLLLAVSFVAVWYQVLTGYEFMVG